MQAQYSISSTADSRQYGISGPLHVVSLFSGAGGLDKGFELQGRFKVIFANEILRSAAATYSKNLGVSLSSSDQFAKSPFLPAIVNGDVLSVDFSQIKDRVDVVAGGPPCQDFSIVRGPGTERMGIKVKRGRLYAFFIKALLTLKPKVFVFENVPGLVTANQGLAFRSILEDFMELEVGPASLDTLGKVKGLSYELIHHEVVNFSWLGVPQERRRLIVIGVRHDIAKHLGELKLGALGSLVGLSLKGSPDLFHTYPLTPIEVFEGKVLTELQDVYEATMRSYDNVWDEVGTERARIWKTSTWDVSTFDVVKDYCRINRVREFSEHSFGQAMNQHKRMLQELGYWRRNVSDYTQAE